MKSGIPKFINELSSINPLLKSISVAGLMDISQNFRNQSSPEGVDWAKLKDSTKARRRGNGDSAKILMDTGTLRNSCTTQIDSGNTRVLWGVTKTGFYGVTHQFGARKGQFGTTKRGSPIPWGDIPARPFIGLSAKGKLIITNMFSTYIKKIIKRAGVK